MFLQDSNSHIQVDSSPASIQSEFSTEDHGLRISGPARSLRGDGMVAASVPSVNGILNESDNGDGEDDDDHEDMVRIMIIVPLWDFFIES